MAVFATPFYRTPCTNVGSIWYNILRGTRKWRVCEIFSPNSICGSEFEIFISPSVAGGKESSAMEMENNKQRVCPLCTQSVGSIAGDRSGAQRRLAVPAARRITTEPRETTALQLRGTPFLRRSTFADFWNLRISRSATVVGRKALRFGDAAEGT
jgi:hypothetical protein